MPNLPASCAKAPPPHPPSLFVLFFNLAPWINSLFFLLHYVPTRAKLTLHVETIFFPSVLKVELSFVWVGGSKWMLRAAKTIARTGGGGASSLQVWALCELASLSHRGAAGLLRRWLEMEMVSSSTLNCGSAHCSHHDSAQCLHQHNPPSLFWEALPPPWVCTYEEHGRHLLCRV